MIKATLVGAANLLAFNRALAGGNIETARQLAIAIDGRWRVMMAKWVIKRHRRRLQWHESALGRWSRTAA